MPARLAALAAIIVSISTPALAGEGAAPPPPFAVKAGLFDASRPDLGLQAAPGTETVAIFEPRDDTDHFANGVVLFPFGGKLYAQWQSSARDEDASDTQVAYAVSDDGRSWSAPRMLTHAGTGGALHSSGGWWSDGRRLVAYINVWPSGFESGAGGYTEYRLSRDGEHWSAPRRVLGKNGPVDGIIEQDPHALADGRIVTAFHLRPGLKLAPYYTDDALGIAGWVRGAMTSLPFDGNQSRELEPSWFARGRCLVMVFRDQASSFKLLAAQSCDRAVTWSTSALTDMPDSRAKQSAGNLPDGSAFLVNAPSGTKVRIPLVLTTSADGNVFDRAWLLRGAADLQPLRYEGKFKRPGYHYPKSVIWNGFLYVGYATNKEDVELTRVPLKALSR